MSYKPNNPYKFNKPCMSYKPYMSYQPNKPYMSYKPCMSYKPNGPWMSYKPYIVGNREQCLDEMQRLQSGFECRK